MAEVVGPGHRHGARAGRGVRAGRPLSRHDRPALPAVRADDRLLGGDLGVQRAHADAGAVGPAAARRAAGEPVLEAGQLGHRRRHARLRVVVLRFLVRSFKLAVIVVFLAGLVATVVRVDADIPTGFVPDEDPGSFIITCRGRAARRSATRSTSRSRPRRSWRSSPRSTASSPSTASASSGSGVEPRHDVRAAAAVRRAPGRGALGDGGRPAGLRPVQRHHAARSSCRSCRRRSRASADSAASSSRCSTKAAANIDDLARRDPGAGGAGKPDARAHGPASRASRPTIRS